MDKSLMLITLLCISSISFIYGDESEETNYQQPKFSSKFNSAINKRKHSQEEGNSQRDSRPDESIDYGNGFPSGFTQGLPTFDFSGSMAQSNPSEQSTSDTENVGFVHGPPAGFPSLSQLGGDFPPFESSSGEQNGAQHRKVHKSPQISHHPQNEASHSHPVQNRPYHPMPIPLQQNNQHHQHSSHHGPSHNNYEDGEYIVRPVPNSAHGPPPRYPLNKHKLTKVRHGEIYRPEAESSHESSEYSVGGQMPVATNNHHYSSNKPHVLKVSSLKTRPTKLPPPPPPFYAPSPDQEQKGGGNHKYIGEHGEMRHKRSLPSNNNEIDQMADGSEIHWETSPFISFDNYEKRTESNKNERNSRNGSRRSLEGGEEIEGGEQRFFPSFPPPYLAPFAAPQNNRPVFPGPVANRAPSRYHPQHYATSKYPNRGGPMGAYSAESVDTSYQDNNLLGSGNFEVVRGGTYYGDEDEGNYHPGFHGGDEGDYYNSHSGNNGYRQQGDFFANFRDFADINPPSRSFSHHIESAVRAEGGARNIREKIESRSDSTPLSFISGSSDPMMATN